MTEQEQIKLVGEVQRAKEAYKAMYEAKAEALRLMYYQADNDLRRALLVVHAVTGIVATSAEEQMTHLRRVAHHCLDVIDGRPGDSQTLDGTKPNSIVTMIRLENVDGKNKPVFFSFQVQPDGMYRLICRSDQAPKEQHSGGYSQHLEGQQK